MPDIQHNSIALADIHQITNWVWPDEATRLAEVVTAADLYKVGFQQSDENIYILINTLPTWKQLLGEGSEANPTGPAGGALTGNYPDPGIADDTHNHTPGITIPAYPTTLPPDGPAASVDITGTYPNPVLTTTGVSAGTYNRATVEVDTKGRIITISANTDPPPAGTPFPGFNNVTLTGTAIAPDPEYENDSTEIATTRYVTRGNIVYPVLEEGETLTVLPGYQKTVWGSYTLEDNPANPPTTVLHVRGTFWIVDDEGAGDNYYIPDDVEPIFTPLPFEIPVTTWVNIPTMVIPRDNFKFIPSGFQVQTPIEILGTLIVI